MIHGYGYTWVYMCIQNFTWKNKNDYVNKGIHGYIGIHGYCNYVVQITVILHEFVEHAQTTNLKTSVNVCVL